MIDPISDMLTRIRNAIKVRHEKVAAPYSKLKSEILSILKKEGYIEDYGIVKQDKINILEITLSYNDNVSKITDLQKISKPSQRIYVDKNKIPRFKQGLGLMIISTSKGLMTDKQARKNKIGGELMCEVW